MEATRKFGRPSYQCTGCFKFADLFWKLGWFQLCQNPLNCICGYGSFAQSCKLLQHLGRRCPVGLEASSRMFRVNPVLSVMSRIWREICSFLLQFAAKSYWYDTCIWYRSNLHLKICPTESHEIKSVLSYIYSMRW